MSSVPTPTKSRRKVIITCAVTGAIHTPTMSPYLPITADEIAEAAIGAHKAGAAIVHLHARDPKDGRPDQRPEAFEPFLKKIKAACNVVINITTGGAPTMLVEERLKPCAHFKPEVASLNMGSMNFGLFPMLGRYREFKFDWERPYLAGSDDRIFKNTFKDIENILTTCRANGTRFEIECYDIGHLYTLRHFADRGLVQPPFFIQSVFGILGGIGPHPEDVAHMRRTADRLFGHDYEWSVLGAGRNQLAIAAQSAALGGNIRVGLEDSLWLGPGKLAETNAQPGVSVFTLWDLQPVDAGEVVAKAKVTPLAISERTVKQVEGSAWGASGLVTVRGFAPRTIGAVSRESLEPKQRARFEAALQEKVDWFGSRLLPLRYSGGDAGAVAADIEALIGEGADLVIMAGASALDPLDPVFLGIERAGGRMERHGVPAHPGSLLFLAWIGERPVLGMPTCGMFSQATTFDLVLPRLLAGERLDNAALAGLGEGGLMSAESAWRFPPYRKNAARGELDG